MITRMCNGIRFVGRLWPLGAVLMFAAALVMAAGCGTPKPKPDVPPGEVSCLEGCNSAALLGCDVSMDLCMRACQAIAGNDPTFPTCLWRATTCAHVTACGN